MRVMKHFAEVIGRGIKARLEAKLAAKPGGDNKKKRANTWSVRNKMRRFYNMWERRMHLSIADEVKESMAPVSANPSLAELKHCCMTSVLTGKSTSRVNWPTSLDCLGRERRPPSSLSRAMSVYSSTIGSATLMTTNMRAAAWMRPTCSTTIVSRLRDFRRCVEQSTR